jgi:nitrogen regulatory protein PII-like uncharacterized protein
MVIQHSVNYKLQVSVQKDHNQAHKKIKNEAECAVLITYVSLYYYVKADECSLRRNILLIVDSTVTGFVFDGHLIN